MKLSNRIEAMKYSPIRKLAPAAAKARANGTRVLGLNIGQPDIETPEGFFQAVRNFDSKVLAYSESQGEEVLIQSFLNYYRDIGISFSRENLLVTNGGSEALFFALFSICDEDDEVLIPEPFYTNYSSFTDMAGLKVVPMTTYAEDGFHLPSREKIESLITPRTKAILFSNPSNPTGTIYTADEVRMLVDLALQHGLYLITDEVYREFVYDGETALSPLSFKEAEDSVILIDSISKRYSSCGARIGIVASKNRELIANALKLSQARLSSPTLDQVGAAALYDTPAAYFQDVIKEYTARRDTLYEGLKRIPGVKVKRPNGAFYMMAVLPIRNAEHFCQWILESYELKNTTIMMAPAEGFYLTPGLGVNEVRLSYCINIEDLKLAVEILERALEAYQSQFES